MKILAMGAHFDDIELGCGGSLLKWSEAGNEIYFYIATKSGYADASGRVIRANESARQEGRLVASQIDAKLYEGNFLTFEIEANEDLHKSLLKVLEEVKPDLVLCHWFGDTHHDHRVLSQAFMHVSRRVKKILFYRSNWYQSTSSFHPNYFVDISNYLFKKIDLVKTHDSEFGRTMGAWSKFIQSQAEYYGLIANLEYAEGFELIKWVEI